MVLMIATLLHLAVMLQAPPAQQGGTAAVEGLSPQGWVFLALYILAAGVGSYGLYRAMLRPSVEYGEWDPANLRRLMWFCFLFFSALACTLQLALSNLYILILFGLVVVFGLILYVTRRRVEGA